jgi:hypothetical protein
LREDDPVRRSKKRRERGNEAPMVITPRAIVRLLEDVRAAVRRRRS